MTKQTVIQLIKAKNAKLANPDFDFNRELDDVLALETWAVEDARLLTWAEVDAITA